jgi:16S rRNA G966 N2-methylase RsmD
VSETAAPFETTGPGGGRRVTDNPIDFSVPHRTRVTGGDRHFGFLPFFAKKPWPVVQEYIKHYTWPGDLTCDPFAGSGVTAVESLVLGRRSIASDINPVARFITRMTAVSPVDLDALRSAYDDVERQVAEPIDEVYRLPEHDVAARLDEADYPRVELPSTVARAGISSVAELHTPRQLLSLTLLRDAIREVSDPIARDLLRVALANTVRYANKTYQGRGNQTGSQYRGNANFLRRFSFSPASAAGFYEHHVWEAFERCFRAVVDAKQETNRLIGTRYSRENLVIGDVPAARIHELAEEGTVDYVFTDPPYSNDIYFLDLSVLWAAWLDLEITDEARQAELVIGGTQRKSRAQFEDEFAAAMQSIARVLKPERWFTLIYKHNDLSLWQLIVAACEQAGLRYVNAVWQDVRIRSTRQVENPKINPTGDMYLNFRKLSPSRFEMIYGPTEAVDIPTPSNYVAREAERLIVAYLGADIELIAAGVIQQTLDNWAFRNYRQDPEVVQENIRAVLNSPSFATWEPAEGKAMWVMAPDAPIDPSLPLTDRARYYLFDLLRQREVVTEGQARQHLLTRLARDRHGEAARHGLDVRRMLAGMADEVSEHEWRLDLEKITNYRQLRLFFWPSKADTIRKSLERRMNGGTLQPDLEGIALLLERLREANRTNRGFKALYDRLMDSLQIVLSRLQADFSDRVERVLAVGEWATYGIDLRSMPYEEVVLEIVLRAEARPLALYREIADQVFGNLNDDQVFLQFRLETLGEWEHALARAQATHQEDALGVSLLVRA